MRTHQALEKNSSTHKSNASTPNPLASRPFAVQPKVEETERSALRSSASLSPETKGYESTLGNFAILNPEGGRSLPVQPKLAIGAPGDKYEQEADQVAQQVVQRLNAPQSPQLQQQQTLQRQEMPQEEEGLQMKPEFTLQREANPGEEDELQMMPMLQRQEMPQEEEGLQMKPELTIQREANPGEEDELQMMPMLQRQEMPQEEEGLQMKPELTIQREANPGEEDQLQMMPMLQLQGGQGGMAATPKLESSIQQLRGSGQPLADTVRQPMERAFGADFSRVKVHTNAQSDQLNRSIQARAFTTGQDVFFRQGEYNPGSRDGQELIAHELTHTLQQTGSIQRKVDHSFVGKVGFKAKMESGHNEIFRKILATFKKYEKTNDSGEERALLNQIIQLCTTYTTRYKGKNSKKDQDVTILLADCQDELPKIDYRHDMEKGLFKYLTTTGKSANRHSEDDKTFAKTHKLHEAELTAIRAYTAGDYKYMNPTVAGNEGWLETMIKQLLNPTEIKDKEGKKIGGGDAPPEWRDTEWSKQMLAAGGKATDEQKEEIKQEGKRHTNMALSGLQKLPDVKTTTYRGEGFSEADFHSRYQKGKAIVFPAFTSTSLDEDKSKKFARDNADGGKVGILLVLTVTKGKDISAVSNVKSEAEILLLPGATFKVDNITKVTQNGTFYQVEMKQTA